MSTMPLLQNFRENLRRVIDEAGSSKTSVAKSAGIHRVTLHKILAGEFEPSLEMCEKLAESLGFRDPEEIFKKSLPSRRKTA
jgi:DNA-binding XRE family transcriptional regulator